VGPTAGLDVLEKRREKSASWGSNKNMHKENLKVKGTLGRSRHRWR
jgi:hypothetical protein